MSEILLGKQVSYRSYYNKSLLHPIERSLNRDKILIQKKIPFKGYDLWNCYELSWLNLKGKPEVRIAHFNIPANSKYLIESKSLKLYLNSFNNSKFASPEEVLNIIQNDLSDLVATPIKLSMKKLSCYQNQPLKSFDGILLDDLDTEIINYQIDSKLLKINHEQGDNVKETLCSNLLKSNCLITGQPDWASVQIEYTGWKINHQALLQYLVSYRNHNGFHEDCVERIFVDILENCKPRELTISAKYTRRGGIDICPVRTNLDLQPEVDFTKNRDVRQ